MSSYNRRRRIVTPSTPLPTLGAAPAVGPIDPRLLSNSSLREDMQAEEHAYEERDRAAAQAADDQQRAAAVAAKHHEKVGKERIRLGSFARERELDAQGIQHEKDPHGQTVVKNDPLTGRPKMTDLKGPMKYDATGRAYQMKREDGEMKQDYPDADAKIDRNPNDPTDKALYRQNKLKPWDHIDPEQALQDPDPKLRTTAASHLMGLEKSDLEREKTTLAIDLRNPDFDGVTPGAVAKAKERAGYNAPLPGDDVILAKAETVAAKKRRQTEIDRRMLELGTTSPDAYAQSRIGKMDPTKAAQSQEGILGQRFEAVKAIRGEIDTEEQALRAEQEAFAPRLQSFRADEEAEIREKLGQFKLRADMLNQKKATLNKGIEEVSAFQESIKQRRAAAESAKAASLPPNPAARPDATPKSLQEAIAAAQSKTVPWGKTMAGQREKLNYVKAEGTMPKTAAAMERWQGALESLDPENDPAHANALQTAMSTAGAEIAAAEKEDLAAAAALRDQSKADAEYLQNLYQGAAYGGEAYSADSPEQEARAKDWGDANFINDPDAPSHYTAWGELAINPTFIFRPDQYTEAVQSAKAPPFAKERAMQALAPMQAQAAKPVFRGFQEAALTQNDFLKSVQATSKRLGVPISQYSDPALQAKAVQDFMESPDFSENFNQIALGASRGMDQLQQQMAGVGSFFGSDSAQKFGEKMLGRQEDAGAAAQAGGGSDMLGQVVSGGTSLIPSIGAGLLSGGAGLGAAGALTAGSVAAGLQSGGATMIEARKAGMGQLGAMGASLASGLITGLITKAGGSTGAEAVFKKLFAEKATMEAIKPAFRAALVEKLKGYGIEGLKEIAEEVPDQFVQNLLAGVTYKPGQDVTEGLWDTAVVSFILGGGVNAATDVAGGAANKLNAAALTRDFSVRMELGKRLAAETSPEVIAGIVQESPLADKAQGFMEQLALVDARIADGEEQLALAEKPAGKLYSTKQLAQAYGDRLKLVQEIKQGVKDSYREDAFAEIDATQPQAPANPAANTFDAQQATRTLEDDKARAKALVSVAAGEVDALDNRTLALIDLARDDKGQIVPAKGKTTSPDGLPRVTVENGQLIIGQGAIDRMQWSFPKAADLIGKTEQERRQEVGEMDTETAKKPAGAAKPAGAKGATNPAKGTPDPKVEGMSIEESTWTDAADLDRQKKERESAGWHLASHGTMTTNGKTVNNATWGKHDAPSPQFLVEVEGMVDPVLVEAADAGEAESVARVAHPGKIIGKVTPTGASTPSKPAPTATKGPGSSTKGPKGASQSNQDPDAEPKADKGTFKAGRIPAEKLTPANIAHQLHTAAAASGKVDETRRKRYVSAGRALAAELERWKAAFPSGIHSVTGTGSGGLQTQYGKTPPALSIDFPALAQNLDDLAQGGEILTWVNRVMQEEVIHSVALELERAGTIDLESIYKALPAGMRKQLEQAYPHSTDPKNLGHEFFRMWIQQRIFDRKPRKGEPALTEQTFPPSTMEALRKALNALVRYFRDLAGALQKAKAKPETVALVMEAGDLIEAAVLQLETGAKPGNPTPTPSNEQDNQTPPPQREETPEATPGVLPVSEVRDGQTAPAPEAGTEGPAAAETPVTAADLTGEKIDKEWTAFAEDSGSLGIPRADMPQIKTEHRGALANFLKARGIDWTFANALPGSLKPTQAEFSPAKVQKAADYMAKNPTGTRDIMVSRDRHVVDGHHQWVEALQNRPGEQMGVFALDASIQEILELMKEFPSATKADGSPYEQAPAVVADNATTAETPENNETAPQVTKPAPKTPKPKKPVADQKAPAVSDKPASGEPANDKPADAPALTPAQLRAKALKDRIDAKNNSIGSQPVAPTYRTSIPREENAELLAIATDLYNDDGINTPEALAASLDAMGMRDYSVNFWQAITAVGDIADLSPPNWPAIYAGIDTPSDSIGVNAENPNTTPIESEEEDGYPIGSWVIDKEGNMGPILRYEDGFAVLSMEDGEEQFAAMPVKPTSAPESAPAKATPSNPALEKVDKDLASEWATPAIKFGLNNMRDAILTGQTKGPRFQPYKASSSGSNAWAIVDSTTGNRMESPVTALIDGRTIRTSAIAFKDRKSALAGIAELTKPSTSAPAAETPVPAALAKEEDKSPAQQQVKPPAKEFGPAMKKYLLEEIQKALKATKHATNRDLRDATVSDPANVALNAASEAIDAWMKKRLEYGADWMSYEKERHAALRGMVGLTGVKPDKLGKHDYDERYRSMVYAASPKVVIEIPGDGTFEILDSRESLQAFGKVALKFPVTVPRPDAPAPLSAPNAKPSGIKAPGKNLSVEDTVKALAPALHNPKVEGRDILTVAYSNGSEIVVTDGRRLVTVKIKGAGTPEKPAFYSAKGAVVPNPTREPSEKGGPAVDYPNYKQVIPDPKKLTPIKLPWDTEQAIRSLRQAMAIVEDKSRLSIGLNPDGTLGLMAQTDDVGSYEHNWTAETVPLQAVNAEWFLDGMEMMRALGHTQVSLSFGTEDSWQAPMTITSPDKSALYVLMGVNIAVQNESYEAQQIRRDTLNEAAKAALLAQGSPAPAPKPAPAPSVTAPEPQKAQEPATPPATTREERLGFIKDTIRNANLSQWEKDAFLNAAPGMATSQEDTDDFLARVREAARINTEQDAKENVPAPVAAPTPAAAPAKPPRAVKTKKTAEKAQDFGEKIGGARKDKWKERGLSESDYDGLTDTEKQSYSVKPQVFPKPDYAKMIEDGMTRETAWMVKEVYDAIAPKPNLTPTQQADPAARDAALRRYVVIVSQIRDGLAKVKTPADLEALRNRLFVRSDGRMLDIPSKQALTVSSKVARNSYQLLEMMANGTYRKYQIERDLKKNATWPEAQEAWQRQFTVHKLEKGSTMYDRARGGQVTLETDEYFVTRKNSGSMLVTGLLSKEEAEAWAKAKSSPAGGTQMQRPLNPDARRTGPDYREGKNVTGQDLLDTFGFRGGEFGNWTNEADRQQSLNQAYDGLMDLARVLNVPPKAIGLNGDLGIAFGARGSGRAAAHYESAKIVINLTRTSGAGALAHEWAHALDDYFGRMATGGQSAKWVSHSVKGNDKFREEMATAINAVMKAIQERQWTAEEYVDDLKARNEKAKKSLASWFRSIEMAASQVTLTEAEKAAAAGFRDQLEGRTLPPPTESGRPNMDAVAASYTGIYDQAAKAQGKRISWPVTGGGKLADLNSGLGRQSGMLHYTSADLARTEAGDVQVPNRTVETNVLKASNAMPGDYWSRRHELFARTFESWVQDSIQAEGNSSPYLVQSTNDTGDWGSVYPQGDERAATNAAFQAFAAAMQTKETDKGVALQAQPVPKASAPKDGFYSAAVRLLEAKMPARAPKMQVVGLLTNPQNGVKADELKWTGLLPWLSAQPEPVSKEAVLDYLRGEGNVQFEEVVAGANRRNGAQVVAAIEALGYGVEEDNGQWSVTDEEGEDLEYSEAPENLRVLLDELQSLDATGEAASLGDLTGTKYAQYQLPGGENYREVVLAMPTTPDTEKTVTGFVVVSKDGRFKSLRYDTEEEAIARLKEAEANAASPGGYEIKPVSYTHKVKAATDYKSSHFTDVPNYVAHMRTNERADATGAPGLFIEELQSDRGQSIRKESNAAAAYLEANWVEVVTKMKKDGILKVVCP